MTASPSEKPGLSFSPTSDGLAVILRADQIRHDTITGLVAEWQEAGAQDDVEEALERLADVAHPGADVHPAVLDARVEAVEDAACMGVPRLAISWADAERLRDELDALLSSRAQRFGCPVQLPRQRAEGGAAA